jgi:4-hydroxy-3-methylbut-2-enyl diphosphate reductase
VIGGYNSSNTGHLAEMAAGKVRAFHIDGPAALRSRDVISHKPVGVSHEPAGEAGAVETRGWLPPGPATIGVTAGASTPDVTIGAVVERVLSLRGLPLPAEAGA